MESDLYTPEIAAEICELLAKGKSLRLVCALPLMPSTFTVHSWVVNDYQGFASQYARAREAGYKLMADEIMEISDDGTNDYPILENGSGDIVILNKPDTEHISRSKLRVDTRKWLLSKMLPKVYGDKVSTEITGADGGPIQVVDKSTAAKQLLAVFNTVLAANPMEDDGTDLA